MNDWTHKEALRQMLLMWEWIMPEVPDYLEAKVARTLTSAKMALTTPTRLDNTTPASVSSPASKDEHE